MDAKVCEEVDWLCAKGLKEGIGYMPMDGTCRLRSM